MDTILDKIVSQKWQEIERHRAEKPLSQLQREAAQAAAVVDFVASLRSRHPMGLIAEVKRASPSAGLIRADVDPAGIAEIYASSGAACISVLTDEPFFRGSLNDLIEVRRQVSLPVLRKDFVLDSYQVWQARAAGADAVLLIAECLDDKRLTSLYRLIVELGMTPLVELYDPANLPRVLALDPPLLGINNRNLKTFETRLTHTIDLRRQIPDHILVVGESGIHTRGDVEQLESAGVHAILVGESLMRSPDPAAAVRELLGE